MLDASNVLHTLRFAEIMLADGQVLSAQPLQLRAQCTGFIDSNFLAVIKQSEWMNCTTEEMCQIVSSDGLDQPEEIIFDACLAWVHHDEDLRKGDPLGRLLPLIRWPQIMSPHRSVECMLRQSGVSHRFTAYIYIVYIVVLARVHNPGVSGLRC